MGIMKIFYEIPACKNLIIEWPNESGAKYFPLSDKLVRLLHIFFDDQIDGYNVKMLITTLFMKRLNIFC